MRLSAVQIDAIEQATAGIFGETAEVWLFGSRVDDNKRGGDIDLLIRAPARDPGQALAEKIRLLGHLERRLGERRIDIVIETPGDARPIVRNARRQGVRLR